MRKLVDVAAAVIYREDGSFLLGRRAADTFYAGYWEFPGGKVEANEAPAQALCRELHEELGIVVTDPEPWIVRSHEYEHAHVRLHFFKVRAWQGEIHAHVHAQLAWQHLDTGATVAPMLPANGPILKALALPTVMGITHSGELGMAAQLQALEQALARGLKLVQIREHALPESELLAFAHAVMALAKPYQALVVLNGVASVARTLGVAGVHLTSQVLMKSQERPDFPWVGASCHNRAELEQAASLGLDYAVLGPVAPTLSHPEQPGLGWDNFAELVHGLPMPVLALGGLTTADLSVAQRYGAHGVAGIRGIWAPR